MRSAAGTEEQAVVEQARRSGVWVKAREGRSQIPRSTREVPSVSSRGNRHHVDKRIRIEVAGTPWCALDAGEGQTRSVRTAPQVDSPYASG